MRNAIACVLLLCCFAAIDAVKVTAKASAFAKAGTASKAGRGQRYFRRARVTVVRGFVRCTGASGASSCCWRYRPCGSVVKRRLMRMRSPACIACFKKCRAMSPKAWRPYVLCWRSCHAPCKNFVMGKSRYSYRYIKLCPVFKVKGSCGMPKAMTARSGRRVLPRYKK